jgi:hypothetical protein
MCNLLHPPVTSSSLGVHILITLFSHTLILLLTDTCTIDLDTSSHNTNYSWVMRERAFSHVSGFEQFHSRPQK